MTNRKRILITGGDGYIGTNLCQLFKKRPDSEVFLFLHRKTRAKRSFFVDIGDEQCVYNSVKSIKPDIIFHTAAVSSLNVCEKDRLLAEKVNIGGTRNLINSIKKVNPEAKLVFFSSDYVFDGQKGNYSEKDKTDPKTFYGLTKLMSEGEIKRKLKNYIICRTANVYGRGGNFFNFILGSLNKNISIEVFGDTYFTPTHIDFLLNCLEGLVNMDYKGLIHVAGSERVSRYQFALKIAEAFQKDKSLLKRVNQAKGGLIARDSSLDSSFLKKLTGNLSPAIDKSLQYLLGNLQSPYFLFSDARGVFLGIDNKRKLEEVNYITSRKGTTRGNHYHKKTLEGFFIIKGKITVNLQKIGETRIKKFTVEKGDIFWVTPYTVHTFEILQNSEWINVLTQKMDETHKDIHRIKGT